METQREIGPCYDPSGVRGTGSGIVPLCTSAVAVFVPRRSMRRPRIRRALLDIWPPTRMLSTLRGFGALANAGRDTMQLKPINDVDITALKRFRRREQVVSEFRASASNLFNHAQYIGGELDDLGQLGIHGFGAGGISMRQIRCSTSRVKFSRAILGS